MIGKLPEPDEVDIVVSGEDSSPDSIRETIEIIKEYKSRAGYPEESREARAIFEALKINSRDDGMDDPDALLDHWRRCVADLTREGSDGQANGESNGMNREPIDHRADSLPR